MFLSVQNKTRTNKLSLWARWLGYKSWNMGRVKHLVSLLMGMLALPSKRVSCCQFSHWRGYSQRWQSREANSECVCVCVALTDSPCGAEAWWITTQPSRCSFLRARVISQRCGFMKLCWNGKFQTNSTWSQRSSRFESKAEAPLSGVKH